MEKNLRKAENAMVKLRNNLKRADLDYTVQASVSSVDPSVVRYAAQMTAPANGLAPVTFIADSPEALIEKIKLAQKNIDYEEVEKAYHAAQIEACHRTIEFHKERMERIDNPETEPADDDETKEVEGETGDKKD